MQDYQYSPFLDPNNDIRLLTFNRERKDVLECELHLFKDDSPNISYYAVSYAWGDKRKIRVLIVLNRCRFYVTANLASALTEFRDTFPAGRHYWIDAISINQQDPHERNHQVRRMKNIYKSAREVLIWLGSDHEPEDDLISFRLDIWGLYGVGQGSLKKTTQGFSMISKLAVLERLFRRGRAFEFAKLRIWRKDLLIPEPSVDYFGGVGSSAYGSYRNSKLQDMLRLSAVEIVLIGVNMSMQYHIYSTLLQNYLRNSVDCFPLWALKDCKMLL